MVCDACGWHPDMGSNALCGLQRTGPGCVWAALQHQAREHPEPDWIRPGLPPFLPQLLPTAPKGHHLSIPALYIGMSCVPRVVLVRLLYAEDAYLPQQLLLHCAMHLRAGTKSAVDGVKGAAEAVGNITKKSAAGYTAPAVSVFAAAGFGTLLLLAL